MRVLIAITHAAFDDARREPVRGLCDQLRSQALEYIVECDSSRRGSLSCWRAAMERALIACDSRGNYSHIVWLPDDAILCPNFAALLHAAIEARPDVVFDCYANNDRAPHIARAWHTTPDGYVGLGGCMPRDLLIEHLAWRDAHLDDRAANDEGVNLWAMATGRRIWKTTRSLVNHRAELPSLDANGGHAYRTAATFSDGSPEDWTAEPVHIGRTYNTNHWNLMTKVRPPMTRRAYEVEKDGPSGLQ
jgi:hypothetical protein